MRRPTGCANGFVVVGFSGLAWCVLAERLGAVVIASIIIGMWLERFVIIVTEGLHRDFYLLPGACFIQPNGTSAFFGGIDRGLFLSLLFLFIPLPARDLIFETRELLAEERRPPRASFAKGRAALNNN